jgi:hypothetical protein
MSPLQKVNLVASLSLTNGLILPGTEYLLFFSGHNFFKFNAGKAYLAKESLIAYMMSSGNLMISRPVPTRALN